MKTWHWLALGFLAIAGAYAWQELAPTGGFNQPPKQPHPDDDLARLTDSAAPHCHPEQHHQGYVYTPHRYPRTTGGEITAAIHGGFSSMRVPNETDVQWLIAPPSEVNF